VSGTAEGVENGVQHVKWRHRGIDTSWLATSLVPTVESDDAIGESRQRALQRVVGESAPFSCCASAGGQVDNSPADQARD
jgi:hypothetical protein